MSWLYILLSLKNNTYYIGSTNNKTRRIKEHILGKSGYTRHLRPLKVMFVQKFDTLKDARKTETRLKKFKSRVIIERIIKDGYIRLRR